MDDRTSWRLFETALSDAVERAQDCDESMRLDFDQPGCADPLQHLEDVLHELGRGGGD